MVPPLQRFAPVGGLQSSCAFVLGEEAGARKTLSRELT